MVNWFHSREKGGVGVDGFHGPSLRQKQILEYVNQNGSAQIRELSLLCEMSQATVRRDLDDLADQGLLERVHGGAARISSTTYERYHSEKMKSMLEEKKRIGAYAASLVKNGESVFLDSGTTTYFIAANLVEHTDLTVITNNLEIACSLQFHSSTSLIVTGGLRRDKFSVLIGALAEQAIRGFHVDTAFLGCDSIDVEEGVFNTNTLEVGVKQQIVRCGRRLVLATDHTKFHTRALAKVCDLSDVNLIVTDSGLEEDLARQVRETGTDLVCV